MTHPSLQCNQAANAENIPIFFVLAARLNGLLVDFTFLQMGLSICLSVRPYVGCPLRLFNDQKFPPVSLLITL